MDITPEIDKKNLEVQIRKILRTVYDPEIPVNILDLGLIYKIEVGDGGEVVIDMTLTAPNCPEAGTLPGIVEAKAASVEGVGRVQVNLVWEPTWNMGMLSEVARLELGLD